MPRLRHTGRRFCLRPESIARAVDKVWPHAVGGPSRPAAPESLDVQLRKSNLETVRRISKPDALSLTNRSITFSSIL